MFRIITACALVSLAAAAVIPDDAQDKIIRYHNENDGSGNYNFSFETSNGIMRKETGRLINAGEENQYLEVRGTFYYTDPNGQQVKVNYRADQNGYQILRNDYVPPSPPSLGALPAAAVATLLGK